MDIKNAINQAEAARLIGISAQLLNYYVKKGLMPGVEKINGKIYYDKEILKNWRPGKQSDTTASA